MPVANMYTGLMLVEKLVFYPVDLPFKKLACD